MLADLLQHIAVILTFFHVGADFLGSNLGPDRYFPVGFFRGGVAVEGTELSSCRKGLPPKGGRDPDPRPLKGDPSRAVETQKKKRPYDSEKCWRVESSKNARVYPEIRRWYGRAT